MTDHDRHKCFFRAKFTAVAQRLHDLNSDHQSWERAGWKARRDAWQKQWFKHRLHGQYLGDQKKLAAVLISRFHVGVIIFGLNERGIDQTQQKQAADEYG